MVLDGVEIPSFLGTRKFQQKYANIINAARKDPNNYWHGEKETVMFQGVEMPASYSEERKRARLSTVRQYQQDPETYWAMFLHIEEYDETVGVW